MIDSGFDPVASYLEWNDRIFERYFPITDIPSVRILSFDDAELRAIATEMGRDPHDFSKTIRTLVNHSDPNPFIWWAWRGAMADRDPPYYVALLAAFSLAASQSGDEISEGHRAYFHRQLGRLLGLGDVAYVPHFPEATALYGALGDYLKDKCDGRRGRLLLVTSTFGGKYVWRAKVQVLLSASSKRQLAFFFDHRCSESAELSRAELRALLLAELEHPGDYAFAPVLAQTLEIVHREGDELFEGFIDLVETEYIRWFLERREAEETLPSTPPADVVVHAPRGRAFGGRIGVASDSKSASSDQKEQRSRRIAAAVAKAAADQRHSRGLSIKKRLLLRASVGNQPWHLAVQIHRSDAKAWQDARTTRYVWGESTITYELDNGVQGAIPTDDLLTFSDYGEGWIETPTLRPGDLCAVVCARGTASKIREAFNSIKGCNNAVHECEEAPELMIVTARVPHLEQHDIPNTLTTILGPDQARVTFRRGLRVGPDYFQAAPPRVYYDHPVIESAQITLDDHPLPRSASRRTEYSLPTNLLSGDHVVEILGVRKQFHVTLKLIASRTDLDDCSGFEVCQSLGVAIPVKEPGNASMGQYMNRNVTIIIGGLLL